MNIEVIKNYLEADPEVESDGNNEYTVSFERVGFNGHELEHIIGLLQIPFDIEPVSSEKIKLIYYI